MNSEGFRGGNHNYDVCVAPTQRNRGLLFSAVLSLAVLAWLPIIFGVSWALGGHG